MPTMIGEALVGSGNEVAHIDLMIGEKGEGVDQAFATSLGSPRQGHTPLLAVLAPNIPAKPYTLMVNKVTIKDAKQATLIFGPAQAAAAKAVVDSVAEGIIPKDKVENILIIVSVFIHWNAEDKEKIYSHNYEATKLAIRRAMEKKPTIEEIVSQRETAVHPFR